MQPYYVDDSTPTETQCTGDAFQYGASGSTVNQTVPNTDPTMGAAATLPVDAHDDIPRAGDDASTTAAKIGAQSTAPLDEDRDAVRTPEICRRASVAARIRRDRC